MRRETTTASAACFQTRLISTFIQAARPKKKTNITNYSEQIKRMAGCRRVLDLGAESLDLGTRQIAKHGVAVDAPGECLNTGRDVHVVLGHLKRGER